MNSHWQKELDLYQAICEWGDRFNYIPYAQRFSDNYTAHTVIEVSYGDWIRLTVYHYDGLKPQPSMKTISFNDIDEAIEWLQKDQIGLTNTR